MIQRLHGESYTSIVGDWRLPTLMPVLSQIAHDLTAWPRFERRADPG